MEKNSSIYYNLIIKYIMLSLSASWQLDTISNMPLDKMSKKTIKQYKKINQSLTSIYYFLDVLTLMI